MRHSARTCRRDFLLMLRGTENDNLRSDQSIYLDSVAPWARHPHGRRLRAIPNADNCLVIANSSSHKYRHADAQMASQLRLSKHNGNQSRVIYGDGRSIARVSRSKPFFFRFRSIRATSARVGLRIADALASVVRNSS